MNPKLVSSLMLSLMISTSYAQSPSLAVYKINTAQSKIELTVFREGLLKAVGHDHTIAAKTFSGEVQFNPADVEGSSVRLSIDAGSLVVLEDPELSEKDRQEVQATMQGAKVLNVKAFPQIVFHSTRVSSEGKSADGLTLTGTLLLHGVEKEIIFPIWVSAGSNEIRATGEVTIFQRDFRIKPFKSVLGTLRVQDQVKVTYDIAAERVAP